MAGKGRLIVAGGVAAGMTKARLPESNRHTCRLLSLYRENNSIAARREG